MSSQLKRMTFSIFMDPGALESDRYAAGILQSWYQRARKIQDDVESSLQEPFSQGHLPERHVPVRAGTEPARGWPMPGPGAGEPLDPAPCLRQLRLRSGEGAPVATDTLIDEIVARLAPSWGRGQPGLADEIVSVWVSRRRPTRDPDSLVDEIVSRIGEQQPTGLWDELKQGLPAPLDHDLLAEAIAASCRRRGEADLAPWRAASSCSPASWRSSPGSFASSTADPAPGQPARPGAGSSSWPSPLVRISRTRWRA